LKKIYLKPPGPTVLAFTALALGPLGLIIGWRFGNPALGAKIALFVLIVFTVLVARSRSRNTSA